MVMVKHKGESLWGGNTQVKSQEAKIDDSAIHMVRYFKSRSGVKCLALSHVQ